MEQLSISANAVFEKGWSVHGDLGLNPSRFALRVRELVEKHNLRPDAVDPLPNHPGLHATDLYLAAACAQGCDLGWSRFGDLYRGHIERLCQWKWRNSSTATDQAQNIFSDLYLPDRSGECRIASYEGLSSLGRWLRVVVVNRSVNERLRRTCEVAPLHDASDPEDSMALGRIETMFSMTRYEPLAALALRQACEKLTPSERLILLWRFEQGLRLGEVARLMGVHQSTITRQMERAMDKVRASTMQHLTDLYGLSSTAVEECLRTMTNNMPETFSVIDLLKKSTPGQVWHEARLPEAIPPSGVPAPERQVLCIAAGA